MVILVAINHQAPETNCHFNHFYPLDFIERLVATHWAVRGNWVPAPAPPWRLSSSWASSPGSPRLSLPTSPPRRPASSPADVSPPGWWRRRVTWWTWMSSWPLIVPDAWNRDDSGLGLPHPVERSEKVVVPLVDLFSYKIQKQFSFRVDSPSFTCEKVNNYDPWWMQWYIDLFFFN